PIYRVNLGSNYLMRCRHSTRGYDGHPTSATWGARCGKSARRVLRGGTGTSVIDARLVPTHHSVPHAELMKSVARRVVDGAMLHLVKMWLEAPVEETDERGNKHRSTRNRDEDRGTPQGSPISPLLSNLYMRRFVLGWKKLGHERRWKAYIVNYADGTPVQTSNLWGASPLIPIVRSGI
ncbi:MAG TPA: reverse transcriptase domain-containing protein, partial [Terriglobales bacterium]|nr:reverse transcriptase domain-containing protein [Terriglobales bacterium]